MQVAPAVTGTPVRALVVDGLLPRPGGSSEGTVTAATALTGPVAIPAGGPLMVVEGQRTGPAGWESEGFAPQVHSLVRHPRTMIARTGDDKVLLVTVDGRQPGYSRGMTIAELADFLIALGATAALSLRRRRVDADGRRGLAAQSAVL